MGKESEPREGFVERDEFEMLRAAMPTRLHPGLTFTHEVGCRTGAMKKVIWPWIKLDENEIHLPAGAIKNRNPITLPLSAELTGMLKKLFRTDDGPVFDTTNFRREWIAACVKIGLGKKTGEAWYAYEGLTPHDFRRSAARNLIKAGGGRDDGHENHRAQDGGDVPALRHQDHGRFARGFRQGSEIPRTEGEENRSQQRKINAKSGRRGRQVRRNC